ncbi:uncharacterized protein PV06_00824 [Exophiala oligosperma]|uniref:DUF4345 domain-containing protein n=2 Tax=Chaetothyriales TaxID=34395 RepID=A0A0D2CE93_9EURO|nr:uncharacterized protein PV06_00824 [Exophiala oligosperma]KAJ9633322.1 hypothetical protein H2204_007039 [Knufia peltigerae]KIW48212.1 hypothetical protein PV06_00824 [Exophiala oligosperma]
MSLSKLLKGFSIFALVVGTGDALGGTSVLEKASGDAFTSTNSSLIALTDSQLRFLGTYWAGYGAMLWWASNDLTTRRVPLAILGATLFASGIGRSISAMIHGFPSGVIIAATGVELLMPPAIWLLGQW